MARYAIGDVQGCFETLKRLVDRLDFDPASDRLWLVGDLVNRGPRSLEVLRFVRGLGDAAVAVLGNHDLHLLARAYGCRPGKKRDTLEEVLGAEDRELLLDWLRRRPLLHQESGDVMVHAGLLPEWNVDTATRRAREVEARFGGDRPGDALALLEGARGHPGGKLSAEESFRQTVRTLTRLRTVREDGRECGGFNGPPEEAPEGCLPWFDIPKRRSCGVRIVCGHWAALGLRLRPDLAALDSGCVWGGPLTALRLEDGVVFQEPLAD